MNFKKEIKDHKNEPTEKNYKHAKKDNIDKEIENGHIIIKDAMKKSIATKIFINMPHLLTSGKLKWLQWKHKNIPNIVDYLGWSPVLRNQHKELQEELKEESKLLFSNHWSKVINEAELEYDNLKNFGG